MKIWIIHCLLLAAIVFVSSTSIELSSTPVTLPDPENLINNISCAIFDVYKASVVAVHKYCTDVLEKVSENIEIEEKEIKRETLSILTDIKTDVDAVFDNFNGVLSKLSQIIDDQASNVGQEVQIIWNELKYGVRRLKRNIRFIRVNMNKSLTEIKENFADDTEEFKDAMDNLYSKILKKLCFEVRSATNMFQHALSLPNSNYFDIELEEVYKNWTQFLQMAKETPNILFKSAKSLLNQLYNIVQAKFFLSGVLSDNSLWPVSSLVWEDAVLVKRFVDNSLKRVGRFIKASLAQIAAKFGKDNFASQEAIQSLYNQVFKEIEQLIATTEVPFKRIYNFDDKQLPFTIPTTLSSTTYGSFEDLLRYLEQNGHPVKCDIAECQNIVLQIVPNNENAQAENFFDYMLSNAFTKSSHSTVSPLYSIILQEERIQEVTSVYRHLYDLVQKCAETAHEDGYKLPDIISMKMNDDAHKYQRLMNDLRVYMSKCVCFIEKSYNRSSQEYKAIMMDFCTNVKQKLDIAAGYTLKFIQRIDSYLKNHQGCLEKFTLNPTMKEGISGGDETFQEITYEDETNTKIITDETKYENLESSTSLLVNSGDEIVNTKSESTDVFMDEQPDNIEEVGTSVNKIQKDESLSQMNQIEELGLYSSCNENLNKASDVMVTHQENIAAIDTDLKTTISSSEKDIQVDNIEDLDTYMKLKQNSDLDLQHGVEVEDLVKNNMITSTESVTKTMSNTATRSIIVEDEHTTSSTTSKMNFHEDNKADEKISETIIHTEASSEENQPDNIEEKGVSSEETQSNNEDTDYETNHLFGMESANSISLTSDTNSVHSSISLNEKESSRNIDLNNLDNFKSISQVVLSSEKNDKLEEIMNNGDQVIKLSTNFSKEKSRDLSNENQQKHSDESHSITEQLENHYYQSSSTTALEQEINTTLASESVVETTSKEEKCASSLQNCKEGTHTEREWSINSKIDDMETKNLFHSLSKEILQDISKADEDSIIKNKLELDHDIASHTASKLEENTSVSIEKEINSDECLKNKIEHNISHQSSTNQVQTSSIDSTVSVIDNTVSEVLASGEILTSKISSPIISSGNKSGSEEDSITLESTTMSSTKEVNVSNHEVEIEKSSDLLDKSSSNERNLADLASPLNLKSITTTSDEILDLVTDDKDHIREYIGSVTPSLQDMTDDKLNKITIQQEENHQNSELSSMTEVYSEHLTEDRVSSNSDQEVEDVIASKTNVEEKVDTMMTDKHDIKSSHSINEVGSDIVTRSLDLSEESQNLVSSFSTYEEKSESKMTEKTLEIDNISQTEPILEKNIELNTPCHGNSNEQIITSSSSSHLNSNTHCSGVEIHANEKTVTDSSFDDCSMKDHKVGKKMADEVNEVSEETTTVMSSRSIDIDEHMQEIKDIAVDCEQSHLISSKDQSAEKIILHSKETQLEIEDNVKMEQNIISDCMKSSSKDIIIEDGENTTLEKIMNSTSELFEESSKVEMSSSTVNEDKHVSSEERKDCKNDHIDLNKQLTISDSTNMVRETVCDHSSISNSESSFSSLGSNSHSDSPCEQNQIIQTKFSNQDESPLLTSQEILHKPETHLNLETLKDNMELLSDTSAITTNTRSIDTDEKILDHICPDSTTIVDHNISNCNNMVETQEIELNDIKRAFNGQIISSTSEETHHKDLIESDKKAEDETIINRESSIFESEIENEISNSFTTITSSTLNSANEDITEHTSLDTGLDKDKIACTSVEKIVPELSQCDETNLTIAEKMMFEETQHESIAKTDSKVEHHDILLNNEGTPDLVTTKTAEDEEIALHDFKSATESQSVSVNIEGSDIERKLNDDVPLHKSDMKKDSSDEQIKLIELSHNEKSESTNSVTLDDVQLKNIKETNLDSLQQDCTSMPDDTTFIADSVKKIETSTDSSLSSTTKNVLKVGSSDETPFYSMLWFPNQKWKNKIPPVSSSSTDENYGWLGWLVPGMRGFSESGKPMNIPKEQIDVNESEKLETLEMKNMDKEESNYSYTTSSSNSETTQSSFSKTETTTSESALETSKVEKSDISVESHKNEGNSVDSLLTGGITSVQPEEPKFYKKWYNSLIKT